MFITSQIPYLRQFSSNWDGFDVVIEPVTEAGANLFKAMEPPAHDAISESWLDDEQLKSKATTGLKQLAQKVRELLERHFSQESEEQTEVEAFNEWFQVEGDQGNVSEDIDPTSGFRFSRKEASKSKSSSATKGDFDEDIGDTGEEAELEDGTEGGRSIEGGNSGQGGDISNGEGHGAGEGGTGDKGASKKAPKVIRETQINLEATRMLYAPNDSLKLFFTSPVTSKILVAISEFGADTQRFLPIKSSQSGNVNEDGLVEISVKKGERYEIQVVPERTVKRAIKISAVGKK